MFGLVGVSGTAGGGGGGHNPASLRGSVSSSTGAVPHSTTKPTGVVNGDVLFAWQVAGGAPALLSGFTSISSGATTFGFYLFSYRVASSEGSSYAFTTGSGAGGMGTLLWAYSNCDATPYENFSAGNTSSNTTFTAPSVTANLANSLWITAFLDENSSSNTVATPPASASSLILFGSGAAGSMALYTRTMGAGATGTTPLVWTNNAWGSQASFIIRSATP